MEDKTVEGVMLQRLQHAGVIQAPFVKHFVTSLNAHKWPEILVLNWILSYVLHSNVKCAEKYVEVVKNKYCPQVWPQYHTCTKNIPCTYNKKHVTLTINL